MKKRTNVVIAILLAAILAAGCGSSKGGVQEKAMKTEDTENETEGIPDVSDASSADADISDESDAGAVDADIRTDENGADTGSVAQISLDNAEGSLVYVRHEVVKNYNGADAVRIYFTYTNKSEETKTAQSTFYPQVFQNGVECDFTIGDLMETNEASDNLTKELMKDASIEVAFLYELQDTVNPVVLRVNDHSVENFWEGVYQEQELALQ